MIDDNWLALMIGNSRLHWGYFVRDMLKHSWDTEHLTSTQELASLFPAHLKDLLEQKVPLYIASVVPSQTKLYLKQTSTQIINLEDVPLKEIYPTMGIDRALALWGAGNVYGFPCLVIDGGTALTFTGANEEGKLIGGAILPSLKLQFQSLASHTAVLPAIDLTPALPPRWAKSTPEAIRSGILFTIIAGIRDFIAHWQAQFPESKIILTGGDAVALKDYLHECCPKIADKIMLDPHLIFWGIHDFCDRSSLRSHEKQKQIKNP